MSPVPAFEIGLWNAWMFMVWLLIQNLVVMLDKKLYQRFGGGSDTKPSQAQKTVSLLSTLLWVLSTAYSIFLPLELGTAWFLTGLAIFLIGLVVATIATINFATTPINEPVIRGAYRYSRHPMYAALILIYLGTGIAAASWVFLLVMVTWVVLFGMSVKDEESHCLERYGEAYRKYMNSTPRWLGIPEIVKAK